MRSTIVFVPLANPYRQNTNVAPASQAGNSDSAIPDAPNDTLQIRGFRPSLGGLGAAFGRAMQRIKDLGVPGLSGGGVVTITKEFAKEVPTKMNDLAQVGIKIHDRIQAQEGYVWPLDKCPCGWNIQHGKIKYDPRTRVVLSPCMSSCDWKENLRRTEGVEPGKRTR